MHRTTCALCVADVTHEIRKSNINDGRENKAKKDKNQRTLLEILANRIVKGDGTNGRRLTSIRDEEEEEEEEANKIGVQTKNKKRRAKETPSNSVSSFPISEDSSDEDLPVSKSVRKKHFSAIREIDDFVAKCERDDFDIELDDDTDVDDVALPFDSSQGEGTSLCGCAF